MRQFCLTQNVNFLNSTTYRASNSKPKLKKFDQAGRQNQATIRTYQIKEFPSIREAARQFQIPHSTFVARIVGGHFEEIYAPEIIKTKTTNRQRESS